MQLFRTALAACALTSSALAAVDDDGNFVETGDLQRFMPPPIEDPDCHRNGTNRTELALTGKEVMCTSWPDPDKQPEQDKILKLLLLELGTYNSYKIPNFVNFYEYEDFIDLDCPQRMIKVVKELQDTAELVSNWHQNFTGTAGRYWYLPREKSTFKLSGQVSFACQIT